MSLWTLEWRYSLRMWNTRYYQGDRRWWSSMLLWTITSTCYEENAIIAVLRGEAVDRGRAGDRHACHMRVEASRTEVTACRDDQIHRTFAVYRGNQCATWDNLKPRKKYHQDFVLDLADCNTQKIMSG
ncbi:hypothetical protein DFH06DRAFT_1122341 [Mycena polygramma]|nr:hypothetical protein DFH06DRAFT_1122341 [Mycena polygramma]